MVNFNGRDDLASCLPSLFAQSFKDYEIIVVDNSSTDDSVSMLKSKFPQAKVIESGKNWGFGAGNNIGARNSRSEYIVFTNYDVEFDQDWLRHMVETAQNNPSIGIVAPKIMLYYQRNLVNTCGLSFQYTGHAFSRGYLSPSNQFDSSEDIISATGCAFLIKRSLFEELGGFDEYYHQFSSRFFHSSLEDVDLSWRAQLLGYKVVFDPRAIMYHKHIQKPLTPLRFYYLECGRYYTLLKNYSGVTLLVLFPAIIFSELLGWAYISLKGRDFIKEKTTSYGWLILHWSEIMKARKEVQVRRVASDREIMPRFQVETQVRHIRLPRPISVLLEVFVNLIFRLYWSFASLVLVKLSRVSRGSQ
jgi:GT2 family glycosyltransferase